MDYRDIHIFLKKCFSQNIPLYNIPELNIKIRNFAFNSQSSGFLPGIEHYRCETHSLSFEEKLEHSRNEEILHYPEFLRYNDIEILENKHFTLSLFEPMGKDETDELIILFHGLNEKHWDKYLSWAYTLLKETGKSVLLFPIAFHMNRCPNQWGDPRSMNIVTSIRKKYSESITNSSFANAAISSRIQMRPQRFFWSGLQTFYDVVSFIGMLKDSKYQFINSYCKIDFFTYSIGSFLGEILMMTDAHNYFTNSKLFMFCGGPTLDRMAPNSKYILDSDATIAIYSFYNERLDAELKLDKRLNHYFSSDHPAGEYFKTMLTYQKNKAKREARFNDLSKRISAIALKKDEVTPPNEVLNTLQGDFHDIPIDVKIFDFPYPYNHIEPFSENQKYENEVNEAFTSVFDIAIDFFKM